MNAATPLGTWGRSVMSLGSTISVQTTTVLAFSTYNRQGYRSDHDRLGFLGCAVVEFPPSQILRKACSHTTSHSPSHTAQVRIVRGHAALYYINNRGRVSSPPPLPPLADGEPPLDSLFVQFSSASPSSHITDMGSRSKRIRTSLLAWWPAGPANHTHTQV